MKNQIECIFCMDKAWVIPDEDLDCEMCFCPECGAEWVNKNTDKALNVPSA